MKINYFLMTIGALVLLLSCKSGEKSASRTKCYLGMKYINYTVLEHCPDILPGDVPSFALEFQFKTKDTVDVDNGFERFRLPYSEPGDSCHFVIKGATQFGDMHFQLKGDSTILLYDSAWTQLNKASEFRRIDEKLPWSFKHYLNECAITGTYNLIKEGVGKDHKVIFLRNGQLDGMRPYLAYEICFAGDCLGETSPPSNTIDFTDDKNNKTTFAFKIAPGRRTIQFFTIGDPSPDTKGERSIGPLAFEVKQ
jgi:hypothetical protein